MRKPAALLTWTSRNSAWLLPASVIIGLALPALAEIMRPLITPAVFLMMVTIFTRIDTASVLAHLRRPKLAALALAWSLVAIPLVFMAGLKMISLPAGLALALVFWASSPPIFSSAALAFILRLDGNLCTALLVAAICLHPLLTPFFTWLATSGAISLSPVAMAARLAAMTVGAGVFSALVRKALSQTGKPINGEMLDGLNLIFMIIFAIGLMHTIPDMIAARPWFALKLILAIFMLHIIVNLVTTALMWQAGRRTAASIGFSTSARNISIAIAVLGTSVPEDTWLFFALIQFPIYLLPVMLTPLYRRFGISER